MKYRSDIDGLRALAVMPVVLFHAGFTSFSGGFVGVDVFFVISGYLITKILLDEIKQGKFSIVNFYERRARRILPALFTVLLFTSVGTYVLYFPSYFVDYAKSLLATLGFSSNVLFWHEYGDYFARSTHVKPLLHTWSLSVEEQFYIFFPMFLLIINRHIPRAMALLLWAIVLFSFAISVYGVFNHPKITFYLLPTRAWELLIGSLAAAGYIRLPKTKAVREVAGAAGFFLIIYAVFALNESDVFPGHNALYPCIGALLIILAENDGMKTIIGRMLSLRPVVFIGLISYSLYLWHWPIIVFAGEYNIYGEDVFVPVGTVVISIVMATITWRFIERPFRGKATRFSRRQVFIYSALIAALFAVFSTIVLMNNGLEKRLDPKVVSLANSEESKVDIPDNCSGYDFDDNLCRFGPKDVIAKIAVWGDSHSLAMLDMFDNLATSKNKALLHYGNVGCSAYHGLDAEGETGEKCVTYTEQVFNYLKRNKDISTVVMIGRWAAYVEGSTHNLGPAEEDYPRRDTRKERKIQFTKSINQTVKGLLNQGKKVALVYSVPETAYNIPTTLARRYMTAALAPEDYRLPFEAFQKRQEFVFSVLDNIKHPNLIRIYPHKKMCDVSGCKVYADGAALYHDDDHLSLEGAEYLRSLFENLLD